MCIRYQMVMMLDRAIWVKNVAEAKVKRSGVRDAFSLAGMEIR